MHELSGGSESVGARGHVVLDVRSRHVLESIRVGLHTVSGWVQVATWDDDSAGLLRIEQ
jgi:hypothetical protein